MVHNLLCNLLEMFSRMLVKELKGALKTFEAHIIIYTSTNSKDKKIFQNEFNKCQST
jgi:hypothetical protein